MRRGEVYTTLADGKRRPVVIATRNAALPHIGNVVCIACTSTVRGLPSEVPIGPEQGIDHESVVNCDWLLTVPKSSLSGPVGALDLDRLRDLDAALRFSLDLD